MSITRLDGKSIQFIHVINHAYCWGDGCIIREYSTFLGEVLAVVWIVMEDDKQKEFSDQLINKVVFVQN